MRPAIKVSRVLAPAPGSAAQVRVGWVATARAMLNQSKTQPRCAPTAPSVHSSSGQWPSSSSAGSSRQPPVRPSRYFAFFRVLAPAPGSAAQVRVGWVATARAMLNQSKTQPRCAPTAPSVHSSSGQWPSSSSAGSSRQPPVRPSRYFAFFYPGWRGRPTGAGVGRSTPGWRLKGRWPEEPHCGATRSEGFF